MELDDKTKTMLEGAGLILQSMLKIISSTFNQALFIASAIAAACFLFTLTGLALPVNVVGI